MSKNVREEFNIKKSSKVLCVKELMLSNHGTGERRLLQVPWTAKERSN